MSHPSTAAEPPAPWGAVIGLAQGGADGQATETLSPEVAGWFSSPAQGVAFAADHLHGPREISHRLVSLGPCAVQVVGSVAEGRHWWGELALRGDGDPETCLVALALEGEQRVEEVVWLAAGAVPHGGTDDEPSDGASASGEGAPDARQVLEAYFADLQAARFGRAAARFAFDGIYSHPPYSPGADRVLWHGRDAIRDGFIHERGESPVRQIITEAAQSGSRAFIRGVVEGVPSGGGGTFLSTAELSAAGEIARYVAFYSAVRF